MLPSLIEASHAVVNAATDDFNVNMQPVIGILSQPLPSSLKEDPRFAGKTTYLMQAYVDFMESAGARVIPIVSDEDDSVTADKLNQVNGVLFPGGGGDYLDKGDYIYKHLISENDAGNFYPLWGTCLGHENLAKLAAINGSPLTKLESNEQSLTLDFLVKDPKADTVMFGALDNPDYFSQEAMTFNHHTYGVALSAFTDDKGLGGMFTPTSTSTDPVSGDTFVATMESPNYPFFSTQFHPEKVLTMYNADSIDHSWSSV